MSTNKKAALQASAMVLQIVNIFEESQVSTPHMHLCIYNLKTALFSQFFVRLRSAVLLIDIVR